LLFAVLLGAWQEQPNAGQQVPAPTIRVSTHFVLVDVVVTDKQGKSVTGLRPEDFVLEENGKTQKIATFITPDQNKLPAPSTLPPGFYSNKLQYRSPGEPVTVILLDALNTAFEDQGYARTQMLKFVQQQYKPGQRMAVFTLTDGLGILQDFTSDPQVLYTAIQNFKPEPQKFTSSARNATSASNDTSASATIVATTAATPPAHGAGGDASIAHGGGSDAMIAAAEASVASFADAQVQYAEDQRAVITLNALDSLARILGGLPGRKNVIWVTGNIPLSLIPEDRTMKEAELAEDLPSLNTRRVGEHAAGNYAATFRQAHGNEIREASAKLSSAQIALYPVDARGLTYSNSTDAQENMRELARETGGRAYVNQNEIRIGVDRAVQDFSATYTLGYYPENKKYDGKYRNIKVKFKRDGVEVQARKGYYALDPTQMKDYNPNQEVAAALRGDVVPSTQVSFTSRVLPPSANKAAPGKIGIDFLVDSDTLAIEDANGGKRINVDFFATAFSSDGKIVANLNTKVDRAFDPATFQQIQQHGIQVHMDMDPQPANAQLRLAVRDNRSGLVGTVRAPAPQ
jgi:VWFA-related protein